MTEPPRILIADDEEIFLRSTATLLERAGYVCTCAADAATVIELLKKESYELLIADIKMPGNPHLEMIRELPRLAEGLPVILVTAYPSLDSAILSIQLPVVAYLVKPFDFSELLTEVRNALVCADAYRAVRGAQRRWQEWGQELERLAQVAQPRPQGEATKIVGALLSSTLHNLRGTLTDLQDLREVLPAMEQPATVSAQELQCDPQKTVAKTPLPSEIQEALQQLSVREHDVLRLLLSSQRTRTIAKTLDISPHTVRNHLRAIFSKLAVHSQVELIERLSPYLVKEL